VSTTAAPCHQFSASLTLTTWEAEVWPWSQSSRTGGAPSRPRPANKPGPVDHVAPQQVSRTDVGQTPPTGVHKARPGRTEDRRTR
jgi:hypothetical protein